MKNYKVRATRNFTDGLEKIDRVKNEVFYCDKERYEFLKSKGAVELIDIQETVDNAIEKEIIKEQPKPKPKKKKSNKK